MARSVDYGSLIACLFVTSISLGIFVLIPVLVALFVHPSGPSFSIDLFNNQALTMTSTDGSPTNLIIQFDLKLKNENKAIGLHYPDPLIITFSYFPNVSFLINLAEYKLDGFYHGNGKTRHVQDVVVADSFLTVLEGTDMIAFRVDLMGTYKYKKVGMKRHKVELGCLVGVDYISSMKMQKGFIGLVEPGLDSKLKKKPPPDYSYP